MPTDEEMQHAGHCCEFHGCKYGEETCPVVAGTVEREPSAGWCQEPGLVNDPDVCRAAHQPAIPAIGPTLDSAAAAFFRANPPESDGMPDLRALAFALSRLSRGDLRADRAFTWALLLDAQQALARLMAAELERSGNAPKASTLPAPSDLDYRLGIAAAAELFTVAIEHWDEAPGEWVEGVKQWLEAATETSKTKGGN